MAAEPRQITITRQGQQFGPYAEDVARQFLNEGKLQGTDMAWHAGAEGWKPLSEVLAPPSAAAEAPPPPPPPDASASAANELATDVKVHISRKGQRMGPYPLSTTKDYFEKGTLQPDDNCWHDGMDGWKPLGELMGSGQPPGAGKQCPECQAALEAEAVFCTKCGFNLQTGQSTQTLPTGAGPAAARPAGPATYTPAAEEEMKQEHLMYAGIAMIVGVVLPIYLTKVQFPNFDLSGASAKGVINMLWPLVVGITMAAMAKTTRDPVRCSVALGISLFYLMFQEFSDSGSLVSGGGTMGMGRLIPSFGGPPVIFFLGWLGLVLGCHARHMRPGNLPAYIIALVGGGFVCLNWLIPAKGGEVPLVGVFKAFDGAVVMGLAGLVLMGAQIAAAVICFVTTRKQTTHAVAEKSMLSLKLYLGSFVAMILIMALYGLYKALTLGGDIGGGISVEVKFGDKLKIIFSGLLLILKMATLVGGMLIAVPIAGSCLLTRLMRR